MTTGTDLSNRALDYADMTGSAFPVDARVLNYINNGLSRLHYRLAQADADWFSTSQDIAVVAGTGSYNLPTTPKFFRMKALYFRIGSARYAVEPFHRTEIDGMLVAPTISGTLNMFYVHEFAPLAAIGDTIDTTYPAGWEDYVAHHAARMLLLREESFEAAMAQQQECDQALGEIMQVVAPRGGGRPERIQEVYGRWAPSLRMHGTVPSIAYRVEGLKLELIQTSAYPYGI